MPASSPCQEMIYDYYRIADGTTAELWVEGVAGDFAVGAIVVGPAGTRAVPHAELFRPQGADATLRVALDSPATYVISLSLSFRRVATATLHFQLLIPAADPAAAEFHSSTPLRCTISGTPNQEDVRMFVLKTKQS